MLVIFLRLILLSMSVDADRLAELSTPSLSRAERALWKQQVTALQGMVDTTEKHATNCIDLSKVRAFRHESPNCSL